MVFLDSKCKQDRVAFYERLLMSFGILDQDSVFLDFFHLGTCKCFHALALQGVDSRFPVNDPDSVAKLLRLFDKGYLSTFCH